MKRTAAARCGSSCAGRTPVLALPRRPPFPSAAPLARLSSASLAAGRRVLPPLVGRRHPLPSASLLPSRRRGLHSSPAAPPSSGSTTPSSPVDEAEFARLMEHASLGALPVGSKIAVAVSGGPDSMALCRLVHRWAKGKGVSVLALTVDHGLRPESRQEAEQVHAWLTAAGVNHEILHEPWEKPKQKSKVQETARKYRYALLYEKCKKEGIDHLLTAHQLEDQVETFLLRLSHRSGVDGLASILMWSPRFFPMQPPWAEPSNVLASSRITPAVCPPLAPQSLGKPHKHSYPPPLYVVRPLLEIPKERLVATCEALGQASVDDPTNNDPTYHRNRIRMALPALWQTVGREALTRTIHNFQTARAEMQAKVSECLSDGRIIYLPTRPGLIAGAAQPGGRPPATGGGKPWLRHQGRSEGAQAMKADQFVGHLYVPISFFLEESAKSVKGLPQPVSMRILQSCLLTVGGLRAERLSLKLQSLREINEAMRETATYIIRKRVPGHLLHNRLPGSFKTTFTCCGCLIELTRSYGALREPYFLIVPEKYLIHETERILPNETLLWENRLAISITTNGPSSEEFFVRRVVPSDYRQTNLASLSKDIPGEIRLASPAILDRKGKLIALPTWNYSTRPDLSFATSAVYPLVPPPFVVPPLSASEPSSPPPESLALKFDRLISRLEAFPVNAPPEPK